MYNEAAMAGKSKDATARADVLIAGGGLTGLALAIALKQSLGEGFAVTLADPGLARGSQDARASAIAAAARRLFETIGVWHRIEQEAHRICDMVVTDSNLDDAMRPKFLTFDGEVSPGEPFAHMVENAPLIATLLDAAKAARVDLRAVSVSGVEVDGGRALATLS